MVRSDSLVRMCLLQGIHGTATGSVNLPPTLRAPVVQAWLKMHHTQSDRMIRHPKEPDVICHHCYTKNDWKACDTMPKLAQVLKLEHPTFASLLRATFPTMSGSTAFMLQQGLASLTKDAFLAVAWPQDKCSSPIIVGPTSHGGLSGLLGCWIRFHGTSPQSLLSVRHYGLLPSICDTGGTQIPVLFATPSTECALGYAAPCNIGGKIIRVVYAIKWTHTNPANEGKRLRSLTGRRYTQNRMLVGDYEIHHVRFYCSEGSASSVDPLLPPRQQQKDMKRQATAQQFVHTSTGEARRGIRRRRKSDMQSKSAGQGPRIPHGTVGVAIRRFKSRFRRKARRVKQAALRQLATNIKALPLPLGRHVLSWLA